VAQRFIFTVFSLFLTYSAVCADFDPCKFNFGTDWDYLANKTQSGVATNIDYVTMWLTESAYSSTNKHGPMIDFCKTNNKTPVFYAYIIAKASGLGDCNTGGKLCTDGAGWLKNNISKVKTIYENYASNVASKYGTEKSTIWLLEPDYYQYFSDAKQTTKLSYSEAADFMDQLMTVVKKHLPNAMFSTDLSPWIEDQKNTSNWYGTLPTSKCNFVNTSGGESEAGNTKIVARNQMTWSGISNVTKKGIIADCGYGPGGGSTGHNAAWDNVANLKARIADGVVAITQKNPNSDWGTTIASLRTQLTGLTIKSCTGTTTKYTLTATAGTGGKVTVSPNQTSFSSGETVTLTAEASTGYKFKNWSGDATGTAATVTLTMTANKTVSAVFEQVSITQYTLTVNVTGSGTVTKAPNQTSFNSGAAVTLTAVPATGYKFVNWTGDVSGTSATSSITMSANKMVTAVFEPLPANEFTLTVNVSGSGSVTKSPDKGSYASGTEVTLTATPASGATFEGWGGDVSGTNTTVKVTLSANKTVTATFKGGVVLKLDTIKVEAESFKTKSGDNIVTETADNITAIGYIENGYSTTYEIDIAKADKYNVSFRVSSGVASSSFGVSVDGSNKGTITFTGTNGGSWTEYRTEVLSGTIDLSAGKHTVQLNFQSPVNVDYILFVGTTIPSSVRHWYSKSNTSAVAVKSVNKCLIVSLPSVHNYTAYSLLDLKGRLLESSKISRGASELSLANHTNDIVLLRLEGPTGYTIVRAAIIK
jgi:hypothetical protein